MADVVRSVLPPVADVGIQYTPFDSTAVTGGGCYTLNTYLLDKEGLGAIVFGTLFAATLAPAEYQTLKYC